MDIESELETLQDIYGDLIQYENNILTCKINEEVENELDVLEGHIEINFTIAEDYPETLPTFELESEDIFVINAFERIEDELKEIIENEFTCIFELVDKVKELLIEIINEEIERKRQEEREKELEEERRLEEEFEGNAKRTFDEWWKEKEKDRAKIIERIKKEKESEINRKKGRLTGKQFFLNKSHSAGTETEVIEEENIEKTLEEQGVDLDAFGDDLNLDDI